MSALPAIAKRLDELIEAGHRLPRHPSSFGAAYVKRGDWKGWVTSAINLMNFAFGESSVYSKELSSLNNGFGETTNSNSSADGGARILEAAKADLAAGVIGSLEKRLSGEIFADFLTLAKNALREGQKDVAAVLACAALEDALKKFAVLNGLNVDGKTMDNVVGALVLRGQSLKIELIEDLKA